MTEAIVAVLGLVALVLWFAVRQHPQPLDRWTDVAQFGDPDLDLTIGGARVEAVLVAGRHILVDLAGGRGWWITHGHRFDGIDVKTARLSFSYGADDVASFVLATNRLDRWHRQGSIVALCSAPDRPARLARTVDDWLPMPRTKVEAAR